MAPRGSLMHFTKRQATTASSRTGRFRLLKNARARTHKRARTKMHTRAHTQDGMLHTSEAPTSERIQWSHIAAAIEQVKNDLGPCVNGR